MKEEIYIDEKDEYDVSPSALSLTQPSKAKTLPCMLRAVGASCE